MHLIKSCYNCSVDLIKNYKLIIELTKKDFQKRYLGSYLGILWAFIHPMVSILIFWFVFEVGFKSQPVHNVPFILWLVTGMFPWFFFSESLSSATSCIVDNSYLVKKVVFRISILPIVKIIAALVIHLFFILILFLMFGLYGYMPSIYNLQIIYYLFANICLVLAISWITSSTIIFYKDIGQIVGMILQFGFWITPVFWTVNTVPQKYQTLLKLNPVYYIVEGYRNSFIYERWFWEDGIITISFWGITIFLLIMGAVIFKKLRPHFADVI